ncbi:MAG TPA: AI-2E family transporter [Hanamia sp.]|nr:AI-2E family transporter [Hanamia sp.]
MKNVLFPFYLKLACVLVILIAGGYLAILGKNVLSPLLFAFLFALLLLPLANFLQNRLRFSRAIASIVSVLIFLFSISVIIYLLSSQIADLSREWPLLINQITILFHDLQQWLERTFHINLQRQAEYIQNTTSQVLNSSGSILEKTVLSVSSVLLLLVFTLIYTFFLLLYRRLLMRFIVSAFTEKYIAVIHDIAEQIKYIVRKYITGLFFEMAIVVSIACIIFWLLGIKYVFLLGLLVGVLNVIPYVGIFTALFISVSITFATLDAKHAFYVAIGVVCIHLTDSNFLMPKIVGSQVKINPMIIILGVVIGEMLWGIAGMFLAVPYIAMAKVVFDRTQGLQPWGILLGDEENPPRKIKSILRRFKKVKNENEFGKE